MLRQFGKHKQVIYTLSIALSRNGLEVKHSSSTDQNSDDTFLDQNTRLQGMLKGIFGSWSP